MSGDVVDSATRVLLALAVVAIATGAFGWASERMRQPRVLGEIVAGIVLGPSLIGRLWPDVTSYVFTPEALRALRSIAEVGLVLFMFSIGLEVDWRGLRNQGAQALSISISSIVAPLLLGVLLALWLHPRFGEGVPRLGFVLFMGAAMGITAFPVLARILHETGLLGTSVGTLALVCAAFDDVVAWCVLAGVTAVATAGDVSVALSRALLSLGWLAVMAIAVRGTLARLRRVSVTTALPIALFSSWVTSEIGLHAIFGAFVAGAIIPRPDATSIRQALGAIVPTLLLPTFFVTTGLSTRVGPWASAYYWIVTALIVIVAVVGKCGAATVVARLVGLGWRDSVSLGLLLNARGLTELVILTAGLDLGLISPLVFAMMVLMALATTFMAAPLVRLVGGEVSIRSRGAEAASTSPAATSPPSAEQEASVR